MFVLCVVTGMGQTSTFFPVVCGKSCCGCWSFELCDRWKFWCCVVRNEHSVCSSKVYIRMAYVLVHTADICPKYACRGKKLFSWYVYPSTILNAIFGFVNTDPRPVSTSLIVMWDTVYSQSCSSASFVGDAQPSGYCISDSDVTDKQHWCCKSGHVCYACQ